MDDKAVGFVEEKAQRVSDVKPEVEKIWNDFKAKTSAVAHRFMTLHNKREVKLLVSGDKIIAETFRKEMHEMVDQLCDLQDETMLPIHEDPLKMVALIALQLKGNEGD